MKTARSIIFNKCSSSRHVVLDHAMLLPCGNGYIAIMILTIVKCDTDSDHSLHLNRSVTHRAKRLKQEEDGRTFLAFCCAFTDELLWVFVTYKEALPLMLISPSTRHKLLVRNRLVSGLFATVLPNALLLQYEVEWMLVALKYIVCSIKCCAFGVTFMSEMECLLHEQIQWWNHLCYNRLFPAWLKAHCWVVQYGSNERYRRCACFKQEREEMKDAHLLNALGFALNLRRNIFILLLLCIWSLIWPYFCKWLSTFFVFPLFGLRCISYAWYKNITFVHISAVPLESEIDPVSVLRLFTNDF